MPASLFKNTFFRHCQKQKLLIIFKKELMIRLSSNFNERDIRDLIFNLPNYFFNLT